MSSSTTTTATTQKRRFGADDDEEDEKTFIRQRPRLQETSNNENEEQADEANANDAYPVTSVAETSWRFLTRLTAIRYPIRMEDVVVSHSASARLQEDAVEENGPGDRVSPHAQEDDGKVVDVPLLRRRVGARDQLCFSESELLAEPSFDEERIDRHLLDELQCALCLEIVRDPVMSVRCQHSFCRSCLDRCLLDARTSTAAPKAGISSANQPGPQPQGPQPQSSARKDAPMLPSKSFAVASTSTMSTSGSSSRTSGRPDASAADATAAVPCPVCQQAIHRADVVPNRTQRNLASLLPVLCPALACDWRGEHSSLPAHLRGGDCRVLVVCQCSQFVARDQVEQHRSVCSHSLRLCACGLRIQLRDLEDHVANDCPSVHVHCEYQTDGCEWAGLRAELTDGHAPRCAIGVLVRRIQQLENPVAADDVLAGYLRLAAGFAIAGVYNGTGGALCEQRTALVRSLASTFTNVAELTPLLGERTSFPAMRIANVVTDSTLALTGFRDHPVGALGFDKRDCSVDFFARERVLIITLAGGYDRFFVIGHPKRVIQYEWNKDNVVFTFPYVRSARQAGIAVHAYRYYRYANPPDDLVEKPFVVQPLDAYIVSFRLHCHTRATLKKLYAQLVFDGLDHRLF
ncbi:Hypothetical protein UVM_LOCUS413 [uncultured virus]|nr:Hypothetical protein UVM_LOCUS413 [uncultured virus]